MSIDAQSNLSQYLEELKRNQDEDPGLAVTALITSAVYDDNPKHTLRELYKAIVYSGSNNLLDPLSVIPILIASRDSAAVDTLSLLGECSSPKEVAIAAQEAAERLRIAAVEESDDDEHTSRAAFGTQLVRLTDLYSAAIPRLKLRKKSAYETIRPLVSELENTTTSLSGHTSHKKARELIRSVSSLIMVVMPWARNLAQDPPEITSTKALLIPLLDKTLQRFSSSIESNLAEQKFEQLYPRLAMRPRPASEPDVSLGVLDAALEASQSLGRTVSELLDSPSSSSLLFVAYDFPSDVSPLKLLTALLPAILGSLQSNTVLDASLSILLQILHSLSTQSVPVSLSPELALPLASTLSLLSASHPHPPTRHITFRLLSQVLALTPPPLDLSFLSDTLSDPTTPPPLRVAAVGLVKDAVLRALSSPSQNIWSSPVALQTLGSLVFRPEPPDLFERADLKTFVESIEPRRLTECLALYYVWFVRDISNKTGIRDRDIIQNIENSLLAPLRSTLNRWLVDEEMQADHHLGMALAGLEVSLERIDGAITNNQR